MSIDQATEQALQEYPVHFTVGSATLPGMPRSGFGTLVVKAQSSADAVWVANNYLPLLDVKLGTRVILKQEIRLDDGWHYFVNGGLELQAREKPELSESKDDTVYKLSPVVQGQHYK